MATGELSLNSWSLRPQLIAGVLEALSVQVVSTFQLYQRVYLHSTVFANLSTNIHFFSFFAFWLFSILNVERYEN